MSATETTALTRERVLSLPAGRELDARIAEHVFGWRVEQRAIHRDPECGGWEVCFSCAHPKEGFPCSGSFDHQLGPCYWREYECSDGTRDGDWEIVPAYSADIAAAWQVVEKMSEGRRSLNPFRLSQHLKGWCCRIRLRAYFCVQEDGETPSLAICRAALLALCPG